ncbi:MAG: sugar phosphate nucleotidyltransferase [Candidatus Hydrothermales bacterium]
MSKNFYAVIMAGGKGERLWPLSRERNPKPFINILGKPLIKITYERIKKIVPKENIIVIVPCYLSSLVRKILGNVKVLREPLLKNTFATCFFSTFYIQKKSKDAVIGIFPADHLIRDQNEFKEIMIFAFKNVSDNILTFGIKPTRPETGYGYIEIGDVFLREKNYEIRKVLKFHEKPDKELASDYLKRGNFLWNSGMFIWRANSFFNILKEVNSSFDELLFYLRKNNIKKFFEIVPKTSIDYALLEKTNKILCIPSDFGWEDLGSFLSFENIFPRDENGNSSVGKILSVDSRNNIVFSKNKRVVLYKVENLTLVNSEDLILVFPKEESQKIKDLLEVLKKKLPKKYF